MRTTRLGFFVVVATTFACAADSADELADSSGASEADDGDGDGEPSTGSDPDPTTQGDPADELPPTQGAALEQWLAEGSYTSWAAESGPHPSAGPHGGDVRTFVNASLFASLTAGAQSHDVGAAVVKELFDGDAVEGWAVMVKVASDEGGDGWYWYERVGNNIYADGLGDSLCVGCHSAGIDHVRTPFPLQ